MKMVFITKNSMLSKRRSDMEIISIITVNALNSRDVMEMRVSSLYTRTICSGTPTTAIFMKDDRLRSR